MDPSILPDLHEASVLVTGGGSVIGAALTAAIAATDAHGALRVLVNNAANGPHQLHNSGAASPFPLQAVSGGQSFP